MNKMENDSITPMKINSKSKSGYSHLVVSTFTPKTCLIRPNGPLYFSAQYRPITKKIPAIATVRFASVVGGRKNGLVTCSIANGNGLFLSACPIPMLPTPGNKSVKFEMTIKMKNDIAKGKTHLTTFGSSTLPIKLSQPSMSASITFWPPDGTSFIFQVVSRTMRMISATTIQVQTIELVTGSEICFGHHTAKIEGTPFSCDGPT